MIQELIVRMLVLLGLCAGIPLLVGSLCGLFVAILQGASQVQEQSIAFGVRLVATCLTLLVMSSRINLELVHFVQDVMLILSQIGRV